MTSVALEAENARLRAALAAAGFTTEDSACAVEVIRIELAQAPAAGEPNPIQAPATKGAAQFRTLTDTIPQLVWRSADEGRWIWASPNWLTYTGQTQEESHDRGWLDVIHPDDRDATMRAWHDARPHRQLDVEHRIRRASDGAWRRHRTGSAPLRGRLGRKEREGIALEWIGASADVEDLRRLQGEQGALLLEVQHRTRNLLAVVDAIARRSLPANPERDDFGARLASIGRVQGFLARSGAWSVPLRDLVEAELNASGDREAEKADLWGPTVELPGTVVQPVALALHELAANAAKHGAIAQPAGHVTVTWRLEEADGATRLVIEWCESGVAMPPGPLSRHFGREVIERTVPHQLRGEARLERGDDGVRCQLAIPFGETQAAA